MQSKDDVNKDEIIKKLMEENEKLKRENVKSALQRDMKEVELKRLKKELSRRFISEDSDEHHCDDRYPMTHPYISEDSIPKPFDFMMAIKDSFAYTMPCRDRKIIIEDLKSAAYNGDLESLKDIFIQNTKIAGKEFPINSRGIPDSICTFFKGFKDKTALMLASEEGHLDCVKFLIEKKADVNYLDRNNKSALDYASEKSHSRVAAFLKSKGALKGKDILEEVNHTREIELKNNVYIPFSPNTYS
jgi:hypothetical protein